MIDLDTIRSLAILGEIDSGKTNLAFYYMNNYKGKRKKYLFGYPIPKEGYTSLATWNDLFKLKDAIIFIDEIQRLIKTYDKKANHEFMELISFFAHNGNTVIFSTQVPQFITRGIESFVDCWAIKRIDLETLKNGCKAKRIIQRLNDPRKNNYVLALEKNEFYEYSEKSPLGYNGIKTFDFQGIGKDWRQRNGEKNSAGNCAENGEENTPRNSAEKTTPPLIALTTVERRLN